MELLLIGMHFPKKISQWIFSEDFPRILLSMNTIDELFELFPEKGDFGIARLRLKLVQMSEFEYARKMIQIFYSKEGEGNYSLLPDCNYFLACSELIKIEGEGVFRFVFTLLKDDCFALILKQEVCLTRIDRFLKLNTFQRGGLGALIRNQPVNYRSNMKKRDLF